MCLIVMDYSVESNSLFRTINDLNHNDAQNNEADNNDIRTISAKF